MDCLLQVDNNLVDWFVNKGPDCGKDKGVDEGNRLLVTSWGKADKDSGRQKEGEGGKEEKHKKVHFTNSQEIN